MGLRGLSSHKPYSLTAFEPLSQGPGPWIIARLYHSPDEH